MSKLRLEHSLRFIHSLAKGCYALWKPVRYALELFQFSQKKRTSFEVLKIEIEVLVLLSSDRKTNISFSQKAIKSLKSDVSLLLFFNRDLQQK